METTEVLVIGGGQAGIAMSAHLRQHDIDHIVLERNRIAERWRSERWDSLVANGPAWHDRFPGMTYPGDQDEFPAKEKVADYFADYASMIGAPVRCGVEVTALRRNDAGPGFIAQTSQGPLMARYAVAATGAFQVPKIPEIVPPETPVKQLHSSDYRNPAQLPQGAVLVVGSGSSGAQIADELHRSGRRVYLSVSAHGRPPRTYRGRDNVWWLGVLNKWDASTVPGADHVTIAVSGARGGETMNFRHFAARGIVLLGRADRMERGILHFAPTLAHDLARGDKDYLVVLDEADAYVARNGLDLPHEPDARNLGPMPECVSNPVHSLDLAREGITSVIWATGFAPDYSWAKFDVFAPDGKPLHLRGVSVEPGLYFLGLPYQSRRGSTFIWGVWHDAKFVADHIAIKRDYLAYQPATLPTR